VWPVRRPYRVAVAVLAGAGMVAMAVAVFLVVVHPGAPSCFIIDQTGVCPIPGRTLVAPLVAGMLGGSLVGLACVAAALGLGDLLDRGARAERPGSAAAAGPAGQGVARPVES
jgi:hypothetical protein